jgi:prepilin-type processing-associated H-X9-DG protein
MYSDENSDRLADNGQPDPAAANNWVGGVVNTGPEWTNMDEIQQAEIYPYVKNAGVYKCPADQRSVNFPNPGGTLTIRSMSMNGWMNPAGMDPNVFGGFTGANQTVFRKQGDIASAPGGSSQYWVFLDENPYSINDGFFLVNLKTAPPLTTTGCQFYDIPASYHAKGGGLSFADGHAEMKIWSDAAILGFKGVRINNGVQTADTGPSSDLAWLATRSTYTNSAPQ